MKHAALVYQGGIANVFDMDGPTPVRLMQHAFSACEMFATGLHVAGVRVTSYACNKTGDITNAEWTRDLLSAPFSDDFRPVNSVR